MSMGVLRVSDGTGNREGGDGVVDPKQTKSNPKYQIAKFEKSKSCKSQIYKFH